MSSNIKQFSSQKSSLFNPKLRIWNPIREVKTFEDKEEETSILLLKWMEYPKNISSLLPLLHQS